MEEQSIPQNLIPIPLENFLSGSKVPVDIYIKLGPTKYVLVAKKDQPFNIQELSAIRGRNVTYIYISREEFNSYVKTNLTIAGMAIAKTNVPVLARAQFLAKAANSVVQQFQEMDFSEETFEHARSVTDYTLTLLESQIELSGLMDALWDASTHILHHSMANSMLSVMIAKKLGWTSRQTLEKLALGGLLHDIGQKRLPEDITEKPKALLTLEEARIYQAHPQIGAAIVAEVKTVPDDVAACILEHHENSHGVGFPRQVKDLRLNPLGRVVAMADCFIDLTVHGPEGHSPLSADDALAYILNTMGQPFNRQVFQALCGLVGTQKGTGSGKGSGSGSNAA
jgi:putative nucleotidyltransferase with HDIG domain